MMLRLLVVALFMAAPVSAGGRFVAPKAPVPFVPGFVGSVSLSLGQDPFYASRLLQSLDGTLATLAALPEPKEAALRLAETIEGRGRDHRTMAARAAELGKAPIPAERAAAVLAANAVSRPDQFKEVLTGLEELKPGLGERVREQLAGAGKASGRTTPVLRRLREAGETIRPDVPHVYEAQGRLQRLFDGR